MTGAILVTHILIALSSLIATTFLAITPSKKRRIISYSLISMTLISGTVLVIVTHSPLLSSCVSGLIYLSVALSGVGIAYYRGLRNNNE